jgi:hypothetical protein
MRVGGRQLGGHRSGQFCRHAVGEAYSAIRPVIVARSKKRRAHRQIAVDRHRLPQTELRYIEGSFLVRGPNHPHEVVDHLGESDTCQGRVASLDDALDLRSRRLGPKQGDDSERVKDGQRALRRS